MSDPRERLAIILDGIDAELDNVRFIPEGANEPLPPLPDAVVISENDVSKALAQLAEILPDWAASLDNG